MATRKSAAPKKPTPAATAKGSPRLTKPKKAAPAGATKALPPKVQRFILEYLIDFNGSAAYQRAGYKATGNSAEVNARRLLRNAQVSAEIARAQEKTLTKLDISRERVLQEIARIAFFDPRRMFAADGRPLEVTELDDDTAAVVAGLDVLEEYEGRGEDRILIGHIKKWKLADKKGALDMLMKHLGEYRADNKQAGEATADALSTLLAGMRSALPVVAKPTDDEGDV